MPNDERGRSEFVYELLPEQKIRLLELALLKDQTLEELVLEAVDRYITEEQTQCHKKF